ncbi:MAG: helix-turn-helix transcriptional regulator [Coxiellaceae bacterium]|nr:helix-turn-helix transcriptional regulator [Coxiellaceae bacterium]
MHTDKRRAVQSAKQLLAEMYGKDCSTQEIAKLSKLSTTTIYRLYNNEVNQITSKTFNRLLQAYCTLQVA